MYIYGEQLKLHLLHTHTAFFMTNCNRLYVFLNVFFCIFCVLILECDVECILISVRSVLFVCYLICLDEGNNRLSMHSFYHFFVFFLEDFSCIPVVVVWKLSFLCNPTCVVQYCYCSYKVSKNFGRSL